MYQDVLLKCLACHYMRTRTHLHHVTYSTSAPYTRTSRQLLFAWPACDWRWHALMLGQT